MRREDAHLALKLENAAVHDRLPDQHRGIVHQVARGEVVRAIDNDVIVPEERHDVVHRETLGIHAHLDIRIERVDRQRGGGGFGHPHTVSGVQHLALQVRAIDHVRIDDAQRADTRRGQVQRRRGAESPGPDQYDFGIE